MSEEEKINVNLTMYIFILSAQVKYQVKLLAKYLQAM